MPAVIFDFDGVLADTEHLHLRAFQQTFGAHGWTLDDRSYAERYLGYDDRATIAAFLRDHDLPVNRGAIDELLREKAAAFDVLRSSGSVLYPSAPACVERLGARFPLAIASGSLRTEIVAILNGAGLASAFRAIVSAEDVRRSKPAPDPYLRAAHLLGVDAASCVVIEDSSFGLAAARSAGMKTIAVTTTSSVEALADADRIIRSLDELTPEVIVEMAGTRSDLNLPSTPLRLHLNENTAGCSPAVIDALRTIGRDAVAVYPDYRAITAECERWLGVSEGRVQLVNGLDEGLHAAAQAARNRSPAPGDAVIVEPAFEMYEPCAEAAGLRVVRIPPQPEFEFPLARLLAAVSDRTRLIYLTDPNNPTGLAIPPGAVERIADAAPQAIVLLDEAYSDFSGRTFIGPALDRHRNLIVGRTFAKAHGLAALRVGALVAHPESLDAIRRVLPPFSLNVCAVVALGAALRDRAYLEWFLAQSAESRALVYDTSERLGLRYWPSEANFVLVRVGPQASDIVRELASQGVLVRDRSTQPGCEGCIRITAGVVEHTRAALTALESALVSIRRG
ncbi:MAG: aminotransferase class I/II-fold pyridoxal phosphate-dependent enzyme [Acidobacteriota bacterium]